MYVCMYVCMHVCVMHTHNKRRSHGLRHTWWRQHLDVSSNNKLPFMMSEPPEHTAERVFLQKHVLSCRKCGFQEAHCTKAQQNCKRSWGTVQPVGATPTTHNFQETLIRPKLSMTKHSRTKFCSFQTQRLFLHISTHTFLV